MKSSIIKMIEYAFISPYITDEPTVGFFQVEDIRSFIKIDNQFCYIITKNNKEYKAYGNHRTLTNRYIYCLEKKHDIYHDSIIKPSINIYNNIDELSTNNSFMDAPQLIAFIKALRPELLNNMDVMSKIY